MAKITTNDNMATPQAGGSVCAIKTVHLKLDAADIVDDAVFNLGSPPSGWNFLYALITRLNAGELEAGTTMEVVLGISGSDSYYKNTMTPTSSVNTLALGVGSIKEFPADDVLLTIESAPATPLDGTLVVTLFGYA